MAAIQRVPTYIHPGCSHSPPTVPAGGEHVNHRTPPHAWARDAAGGRLISGDSFALSAGGLSIF